MIRNLTTLTFAFLISFSLASQSADFLAIPYYKLLAESFKANNFTAETVWKDFFNVQNCQISPAACLNGLTAGIASISGQTVILHKSEKLKKDDKLTTTLGEFIVVDRNEKPISLTVSKMQRDIDELKYKTEQKKLWKSLLITQNDIHAIQNFVNQYIQKNPLLSPLFAATFMTAYKSTDDPFASFIPYDFHDKLSSLPEQPYLNIGFVSTSIGGRLLVIKVDLESPAFWAGLRFMDEIQLINDRPVEKLDAKEMEKIIDTKVLTLKILRNKVPQTIVINILEDTEKKIEYSVVQWRSQIFLKIVLKTFEADTKICVDFSKKISDYRSKYALSGMILDLRDNGGGSVAFATCVASIFLGPNKLFMSEIYLNQIQTKPMFTHSEYEIQLNGLNLHSDLPMATLINGHSASMSEALVGALRDYNRTWSVGQLTFGKGSINGGYQAAQYPAFIDYRTVSIFYQPSYTSNELVGIIPDFTVPSRYGATAEEDHVMRNKDLNPDLPFKRNDARFPPRYARALEIQTCIDKKDLQSRSEKAQGQPVPADYQLLYSLEVLRCDSK